MRAVNLIPADSRSGGGGVSGRSGGAVYVVLGALTALVAMVAVWSLTSSGLSEKRGELAVLQQEVQQAQAGAQGQQAPGDVQQLRRTKTETVKALAGRRIDWAAKLDALARTLPAGTTLTSLDASSDGSSGAAGGAPAAQATSAPSVQLAGCSPSQRAVAQLIPRLRSVPGVTGAQLVSSTLAEAGGGTGAPATGGASECGGATFQMVLTLEPLAVAAPAAGAAATTASATPAAPAPAGTAETAVEGTPTGAAG